MQEYPEQTDCAWLAVDSIGHVGVFITAGVGPIPETVLKSELPIVEIESALLELAPLGPASLAVRIPSPESFIALAKRGLFVYDWQNAHRIGAERKPGYDLVASPARPIDIMEMPSKLTGIAAKVALATHSFSQEERIDIASALPCMCSNEMR